MKTTKLRWLISGALSLLTLGIIILSRDIRYVSVHSDHYGEVAFGVNPTKKIAWDLGRGITGYTGYLTEEDGHVILIYRQLCARGLCIPARKAVATSDVSEIYHAAMLASR